MGGKGRKDNRVSGTASRCVRVCRIPVADRKHIGQRTGVRAACACADVARPVESLFRGLGCTEAANVLAALRLEQFG